MNKTIYTEQDNIELNNIIDTCIVVNHEEKKTDNDADLLYKLTGDESYKTEVVIQQQPQLPDFKHISDVYKNSELNKPKTNKFFNVNKGKIAFSIDNTIFEPTPITTLSIKRFEEKYIAQLEQYIFNDKDDLDVDKIISILHLISFIKGGTLPIGLVSNGKFKYLLPKIVNGMNAFFYKNYATILSILEMFSSSNNIVQKPEDGDA